MFYEPQSSENAVRVRVRLQPAASADKVLGLYLDADGAVALKAAVTKPPEGGKANAALIKMLAKEWGLAKSALEVVKGQTSRNKVVRVAGAADDVTAALEAWAEKKDLRE